VNRKPSQTIHGRRRYNEYGFSLSIPVSPMFVERRFSALQTRLNNMDSFSCNDGCTQQITVRSKGIVVLDNMRHIMPCNGTWNQGRHTRRLLSGGAILLEVPQLPTLPTWLERRSSLKDFQLFRLGIRQESTLMYFVIGRLTEKARGSPLLSLATTLGGKETCLSLQGGFVLSYLQWLLLALTLNDYSW
jgi:hypothetical protein